MTHYVNYAALFKTLYIVGDGADVVRLHDELVDLYTGMNWEEEARGVILTGSDEKSFATEGEQVKLWPLAEPIAKHDKTIMAAIEGDAIGQGLEVALACDIRIASETSRFGIPHIKRGFIPWDGGTQRLSRLVGKGKALEMILTGEVIEAQEALRIGLVHRVVPKKDIIEITMKMAKEMASKGPVALRYTKEAVYKGMDMTLEQGLRLEADLYLLIHTTKDRTEGIQAFREKRMAKFDGR